MIKLVCISRKTILKYFFADWFHFKIALENCNGRNVLLLKNTGWTKCSANQADYRLVSDLDLTSERVQEFSEKNFQVKKHRPDVISLATSFLLLQKKIVHRQIRFDIVSVRRAFVIATTSIVKKTPCGWQLTEINLSPTIHRWSYNCFNLTRTGQRMAFQYLFWIFQFFLFRFLHFKICFSKQILISLRKNNLLW